MFGLPIYASSDFNRTIEESIIRIECLNKLNLKHPIFLEIGLGRKVNTEKVNKLKKNINDLETSIHGSRAISLFNVIEKQDQWKRDLEISNNFNCKRFIMHFNDENKKIDNIDIIKHLDFIEKEASKHKIKVYIENVYHSIQEMEMLFKNIKNYKHISFCFDIGHANVFNKKYEQPTEMFLPQNGNSPSIFFEWVQILDEIVKHNDIHFHLHANNNQKDEHLTFQENVRRGNGKMNIDKDYDYEQSVHYLIKRYRNVAWFNFEFHNLYGLPIENIIKEFEEIVNSI